MISGRGHVTGGGDDASRERSISYHSNDQEIVANDTPIDSEKVKREASFWQREPSEQPEESQHASGGETSCRRRCCSPTSQLSTTGVSIVLSPGVWWPRRLVWLLVLLALTGCLCVQLTSTVSRAVVGGTTWRFSRRMQSRVQLPALTICHSNRFKKDAVEAMSQSGTTIMDWVENGDNEFSLLRWKQFNLDQFINEASYSWEDMVASCMLIKANCSDLGVVQTAYTPLLGTCSTLRMNASAPEAYLVGQLRLILQEQLSFGSYEHDGWLLFLHEEDVTFSDFALFTGMCTPVALFPNSSITAKVYTKVFKRNPAFSTCRRHSMAAAHECIERCIVARSRGGTDRPDCHIPWLARSAGRPPCTSYHQFRNASGLDAIGAVEEASMAAAMWSCRCPRPCRWTEYRIATPDRLSLADSRLLHRALRLSWRGQTLAHVSLWFATTLQTVEEVEAYPQAQFLSDLGGGLGLMVGGSLLTVVELIDCLLCACSGILRHRTARLGGSSVECIGREA